MNAPLTAVVAARDMKRPKVLDLFCNAGGAGWGYHLAGYDVTGVDIDPQPNYRGGEFIQADALDYPLDGYDLVHASPPCQGSSKMSNCRPGLAEMYPLLIKPVRKRLEAWGGPWVIENVEGAGLPDQDDLFGDHGVMLCGLMFKRPLHRHRWFLTSEPLTAPSHPKHLTAASRAGHWEPGTIISVAGHCSPIRVAEEAMGISWMTREELREAIPPAYTEFIGTQMLERAAVRGAA